MRHRCRFYTEEDGWCWFFGAIDHCVGELVGWHTAKISDRWAALEPLRQGVHHAFGRFANWGPQYIADAWINEVKWLGMPITPSYVGEPECNGVIERFMRTLKEQCLYLHRFQSLTERAASSASSSRGTTRSGSSSGSAIRRRWLRGPRRWRPDR